jgi:hypothetical protein
VAQPPPTSGSGLWRWRNSDTVEVEELEITDSLGGAGGAPLEARQAGLAVAEGSSWRRSWEGPATEKPLRSVARAGGMTNH